MAADGGFRTDSGIDVAPVYGPEGPAAADRDARAEQPGEHPFTRGIYPDMYRGRLWTMRQYAGFGTAEETNARFRYLLEQGQTGLSVAFDLPTQMGFDSDAAMAAGEVGRVGVAIDSLDDMRRLFAGIPLDAVSTSMTINATAPVLLALYVALADEQGVPRDRLAGTVQNDVLKEYVARGTYIYPVEDSLRLVADVIAYASREIPKWNPISISGYHIREAGSTAPQEVGFTLANGLAYVERALAAGLDIESFAPRLSFFFAAHNDLLEEVAKFRAARRLWATAPARALRRLRSCVPAPLPHADGWLDADGTAAAQQRGARGRAGARGHARRHAVVAHERLRRGARAPLRAGGEAGAAHAADPGGRIGCDAHRRSARRLVLRGDAHRRGRAPGPRLHRRDRRHGRRRGGGRLHAGRDPPRGVPLPDGDRVGRAPGGGGERACGRRGASAPRAAGLLGARGAPGERASASSRPGATSGPWPPRSRRCGWRRGEKPTCCRPWSRP
jgi:hypothetical protein